MSGTIVSIQLGGLMNSNIKFLVKSGLFAALACVGTMSIQIPTPTGGYIHAGDSIVYLSGIFLGPIFGALAAAIGSMFADVFSGYAAWAIPTFIIKGLDAFIVAHIYKTLKKNSSEDSFSRNLFSFITAMIAGGVVMVSGYYLYERIILGDLGALGSVGPNIIQAVGGGVIALLLFSALSKNKETKKNMEL